MKGHRFYTSEKLHPRKRRLGQTKRRRKGSRNVGASFGPGTARHPY